MNNYIPNHPSTREEYCLLKSGYITGIKNMKRTGKSKKYLNKRYERYSYRHNKRSCSICREGIINEQMYKKNHIKAVLNGY